MGRREFGEFAVPQLSQVPGALGSRRACWWQESKLRTHSPCRGTWTGPARPEALAGNCGRVAASVLRGWRAGGSPEMLSAPLSAGGCLGSGPGQADVAVTILCGVAGLESCPMQPLRGVLPFREQPDAVQTGRCGAQLGSFLPFQGLGRGSRCLQPPRAVPAPGE